MKYVYEQTEYVLKQKINDLFADDIKIFETKNYENARQIIADCNLTADIIERVINVIREVSFKGTETKIASLVSVSLFQI